MDKIDISSKISEFEKHLALNKRTIFSARFGDGKTYFLKEYMAHHQIWKDYTPQDERIGSVEDTYFIVLRPINYVVAKNEDIFEYIKHDILIQLYSEGKIDSIDYKAAFKAIAEVATGNLLPLIGDLIATLPGGPIVKDFVKLGQEIKKKYQEKEKSITTFLSGFTAQKGGLYEKDAYTQLIKTTLSHFKDRAGAPARKVLIIEDMDRLDPGHLFRILNVLGAHIDEEDGGNKFGFDNIILVLDYETTEHIFKHFYGKEANYEGYMNKFVSTCVFRYSISVFAQGLLARKLRDEFSLDYSDICCKGSKYAPQDVIYIRNVVERKSIRQIEKILDNLDIIGTPTYSDGGVVYSTDCPLYGLVKLLLLLDEPSYSIDSLTYSITQRKDWLSFIGSFASAEKRVESLAIRCSEGIGPLRAVVNEDSVVVSYLHNLDGSFNRTQMESETLIQKAILRACQCIKNGSNIRWQR